MSSLLCSLFGHKPEWYEYHPNSLTVHEYCECARCGKRKNLSGPGWIDDD